MKRLHRYVIPGILVLVLVSPALSAGKTIVVTSASPGFIAGQTNLTEAILALESGDTIQFNIPGAPGQVHYLTSPPGGFPLIVKDNVTVNGYTQAGATPNSNPITSSNNAQIKIVLDGRNGNLRNMGYTTFDGTTNTSLPAINNTSMANERPGYLDFEIAVLGIYRATNVTIKGLAILAARSDDFLTYGVAVAHDYGLETAVKDRLAYDPGSSRGCHIQGCWFGVDPTNQTVAGLAGGSVAVTFFRHRDVNNTSRPELPDERLTIGVAPGMSDPRAQFNVMAGWMRAVGGEGVRWRMAGNFVGVLPDGVTPADMSFLANAGDWATEGGGSLVQVRRYTDDGFPIVVGTDGDGMNDADEGNVFGPLGNRDSGTRTILDFYQSGATEFVIAGNSFGIGVDGTRWTNAALILNLDEVRATMDARVRFGSDFDTVSDTIEANRVYNNWPFAYQYPPPNTGGPLPFIATPITRPGSWISLRGNVLVNNAPGPVSPAAALFASLYDLYCDTSTPLPILSTNSTTSRLSGWFGAPKNGFTNVIVDVYLPDSEGATNGAAFGLQALGGTNGWGFVQGRTWLGSFVDNLSADFNPAVGQFEFDISPLGLAVGSSVTVAVTYSLDPAGTSNGRGMTTVPAIPVNLKPPLRIGTVQRVGDQMTLNWSGGTPPYQVTRKSSLGDPLWSPVVSGLTNSSATFTDESPISFYLITGN